MVTEVEVAGARDAGSADGDADDVEPGDLIPADHPIRRIRVVVDAVLGELDGEFDAMYASRVGRVCRRSSCSRRRC